MTLPDGYIQVLDHGYVGVVDTLGTDLSVVNAARVSFNKESEEFNERDERLLAFLLREDHVSPLRHAALTFEVYAPLMVARQWWKHAVGSAHVEDQTGWNESSRRYITEVEEFYVPNSTEWRLAPANSKQGSGGSVPTETGEPLTELMNAFVGKGLEFYEAALDAGVAPEQARLFLPSNGMYVRWRWTASLAAVLHFLDQRLDSHAQAEIQAFARAVDQLTEQSFPKTLAAWRNRAN